MRAQTQDNQDSIMLQMLQLIIPVNRQAGYAGPYIGISSCNRLLCESPIDGINLLEESCWISETGASIAADVCTTTWKPLQAGLSVHYKESCHVLN